MPERIAVTDAHEGPVYVEAERALYFTTARPRVAIRRLSLASGEVTTVRAGANVANGMALDRDGFLLVCEQHPAAIARVDPATGARETVVSHHRGRRLNSPNDVIVARDGAIWFTDPSYAHLQGFGPPPELPDAVYRYDGELAVVSEAFDKPNGLALSPDESVLYVADSGAPALVKAIDPRTGGEDVLVNTPAPDGLKVDAGGRVYVSAPAGVLVLHPSGEPLGEIPVPGAVNFAFGEGLLFVTADDAIWAADPTPVRGALA